MKIRRHYFTLRGLFPGSGEGQPIETTLTELAEGLDCTHRNVVFLLGRMGQEGWLEWTPRRGRGNRSKLVFLAASDALRLDEAKELSERGDLKAALQLLQQSGTSMLEPFQDWLTGQFGFRTELRDMKRSDTLRFPLPGAIESLDPAGIHYFGESHLVNQLYDSLLRMDARGETPLPHLAHAWESNAERTVWTFYLRKGVQFHHGREMTAKDVVYSLERLGRLAPDGLYSWVYNGIAGMDVLDDTTVTIKLKERNEAFLPFLSTNRASIVPRDVCRGEGERFGRQDAGGSVIGTGPFRLLPSSLGIWSLEAFPHYFQGRAFLDLVEVWTLPEAEGWAHAQTNEAASGASFGVADGAAGEANGGANRKAAFGNADAAGGERGGDRKGISANHAEQRQYEVMHNVRMGDHAGKEWQQVRQSGTTCKFLTVVDSKEGPLSKPETRKKLNAAINRSKLLQLLSGDVIEAAESFWVDAASEQTVSPLEAETCDKSELPDIIQLKLATIPQYTRDALLIKELLEESGIMLDIETIPASQFKGNARLGADLLLFSIMLDEHRELRLIDLFASMGEHMLPDNRLATERFLARIREEKDASLRKAMFIALERELAERGILMLLYRKHLKTAFHPSVRGIALESLSWVRFRDLWFR